MTKICILGGGQKCPFWGAKMPTFANLGGQNAHFRGQKCKKFAKLYFGSKAPQKSFGGLPLPKICTICIFRGKKAHLEVQVLFNNIFGMTRCRPTHTLKCRYQICTSKIKMIQIRVGGGKCPPTPTLGLCVTKYGLGLRGLSTSLVHD